jgi:hypothetical protein
MRARWQVDFIRLLSRICSAVNSLHKRCTASQEKQRVPILAPIADRRAGLSRVHYCVWTLSLNHKPLQKKRPLHAPSLSPFRARREVTFPSPPNADPDAVLCAVGRY